MRNVKDVIGAIMRVLEGAEISQDDVLEADGELLAALNDAYIKLLEFAHDRERRLEDHRLDDTQGRRSEWRVVRQPWGPSTQRFKARAKRHLLGRNCLSG